MMRSRIVRRRPRRIAHETSKALTPPRTGIGIALAGGGPLGGIYEVGALLALVDSLDGLDVNELDIYVGVSSGAFVAAALANDISPAQMYRLFIAEGSDARLTPGIFLRPALGEFARRAATLPSLLLRASASYLRHPLRHGAMSAWSTLARAMPTGIFDHRAIDTALTRLFTERGRSNDFRTLRHKLLLVATDLDTGAPVTLGGSSFDDVSIASAVAASAALPGLFPPVEINGRHYVDGALNKTLHASLALDEGVELLLCINPLVPFDASSTPQDEAARSRRLERGGLPAVLAQTFRAIIHSRMKVGMDGYSRHYPNADVLLFEPDRHDAAMFSANIFSYAHRARLCETAFDTTREALRQRGAQLAPVLAKHGVRINRARLADSQRSIAAALHDPRPLSPAGSSAQRAVRDLSYTLDHLERWLASTR